MRRSEQLVALAGAAIGAGASAIWGEHLAAVFAGALLGGSLGFAHRAPRAAWIAAAAALLAIAPYGAALPFGVYLFMPAHAFCAGRWDSRIGGVAALLTLVAACELGIAPNALRYASGAPVHVRLHGATSTLIVEVTNGTTATASELTGLGTGNGLHGLRQRVSACGGTLHAGATADAVRSVSGHGAFGTGLTRKQDLDAAG